MGTLALKIGTKEDLPEFLKMTEQLFNSSVYANISPFNKEAISSKYLSSLSTPNEVITLFCYEDEKPIGLLSAGKIKLDFCSEPISVELALWIEKRTALRPLLKAHRYWSKLVGCRATLVGKITSKNSPEVYKLRKI